MRVLIKSVNVREEVTQKGNTLYKQQCALENGAEFPMPFFVTIPHDKPYPPGLYDFHPGSFRTSRFGGIELDAYNTRLIALAVDKPVSKVA